MGRRITINEKRLTKSQVQELLSNGAVFAQDVTKAYKKEIGDSVDVYKLPDNNYLFVHKDFGLKGKGDIWPKEYVEKKVLKFKRDRKKPHLKGLSNFAHWYHFSKAKDDFPNQVQSLINELFQRLELPAKSIDYSYQSLDLLSGKLNQLDEETVETELYDGIVAYTGEVLIRKINGAWRFQTDTDVTGPIRPLIVTNHRWVWYDPITPIWTDLIDVEGFNLRQNTVAEIRSHQLDRNAFLK